MFPIHSIDILANYKVDLYYGESVIYKHKTPKVVY